MDGQSNSCPNLPPSVSVPLDGCISVLTTDPAVAADRQLLDVQETHQESSQPEVPFVLEHERFSSYCKDIFGEFSPVGLVEHALARDLARKLAAMERWSSAAEATERDTVRTLPRIAAILAANDAAAEDALLAAAMNSPAAERCERQSLDHSKGFLRTLRKLEEVQARRRAKELAGANFIPPTFLSDQACEAHVLERLRKELVPCGKCGRRKGCFLASRRAWECTACGTQNSLRAGTVAANSPLPLSTWFNAIRLLLWRPTLTVAELADRLGLRRLPTVRAMAGRIREAMAADNANTLLVGLDERTVDTCDGRPHA